MKKYTLLLSLAFMPVCLTGCGTSNTTTNTATPVTVSGYTLNEVATHTTKQDCWTIINGEVYDISEYVPMHPGRDKIVEGCGKDSTGLFTGTDPMGRVHSAMAKQLLSQYKLGPLE